MVLFSACSKAFPSRFFLDLSLSGGTPATRQVPPFSSFSGADSTRGSDCALERPETAACAERACDANRDSVEGRPKWCAFGAPS